MGEGGKREEGGGREGGRREGRRGREEGRERNNKLRNIEMYHIGERKWLLLKVEKTEILLPPFSKMFIKVL